MLTRSLLLAAACGTAAAQAVDAPTTPPSPIQSLWLGDLNADGRDDAFVVQPDGSTRLLINSGDGSFEDVTARAGLGDAKGAHMALFGDLNGDGRADLYLPAWNGPSHLMLQTAEGTFVDGTEAAGLPRHAEPIDATLRDVDGDGTLDLWLTTAHDDLVYRSTGRGQFEKIDLGITPRTGQRPESLAAARAQRGLPPIGPGAPGGATAGSPGAGGPGSQPICTIFVQDQAAPSVCMMASSDPTQGMLYPISSDWFVESGTGFTGLGTTSPAERLHVNGDARIDGTVIVTGGGAPFQISSTALVANLNADLLDGLNASAFATLPIVGGDVANGSLTGDDIQDGSLGAADLGPNSVNGFHIAASSVSTNEIIDGTISAADLASGSVGADEIATNAVGNSELAANAVTGAKVLDGSLTSADLAAGSIGNGQLAAGAVFDVHVNGSASIQGTKVVPDFGGQDLSTNGFGDFGAGGADAFQVRGDGGFGPTIGYLGVQGADDFNGVATADWLGLEVGVAGISTGGSITDNFGVLGHSNNAGVRGEHADSPSLVFGELGRSGVGVYGSGTTYAGQFAGRLYAEASIIDSVLNVVNHASGNAAEFEIDSAAAAGTTLVVKHQGTGGSASITNSNASTITPAVFTSSQGTSVSHRTLHAVNQGAGSAQAAFFDLNNTSSSGISTWVRNRGAGTALYVESEGAPIRTVQIDKNVQDHASNGDMLQINMTTTSSATGQFIECERGSDIEFRVDADGDVFADGAYTGPADFAEMLRVSAGAKTTEAADVVCIDPESFRSVKVSTEPYSRLVCGVYSTKPGFVGSEREFVGAIGPNGERQALKRIDMAELYDEVPVAVVGIVPCKISAENGAIRPGDLLVTSSTPGHAMVDNDPPVGTVVGKALEAFDGKGGRTGVIKILVTLQ